MLMFDEINDNVYQKRQKNHLRWYAMKKTA